MSNVIGLTPEQAVIILEKEGFSCTCIETRSKKGIAEGKRYVVRQTVSGTDCVLVWSLFPSEIE